MTQADENILIVDDQQEILNSLQRLLKNEFNIFVAPSGEQGLELIRKQSFAVVVSDQRMPQMDGVTFLKQVKELQPEAREYLSKAGALQDVPIERLFAMNPPAIEIYRENGIDLYAEPLEIAVCAQHNNGGFAVDKWWQSSVPGTFVIGEMAGTHGVKRPGGSALNAGQVGGLRAAEYIVNVYGCDLPDYAQASSEIDRQLNQLIARLESYKGSTGPAPKETVSEIQMRMSNSAGHIRSLSDARRALREAVELYRNIQRLGLKAPGPGDVIRAVRAEHLALASVAYLKAIVALLEQGSGSRGSHLVLDENGLEVHPDVHNDHKRPLKFKPENTSLRDFVLQVEYDGQEPDLFRCRNVPVRTMPRTRKPFEPAWRDYREGKIYR